MISAERSSMDVERIRELRRADPFKPFNLVLNDGRKLPVDRPYFLGISPDGRLLSHASLDGWFERFPPQVVQEIDYEVDPELLAKPLPSGRRSGAL